MANQNRQDVSTDPEDNAIRPDETVAPEAVADQSGQPRAQPEGAQSDSAPVTEGPEPDVQTADTATAPGAGDDEDDAELQAEMERRHQIALRLRRSARQAPKDDPETAEVRQEAGRMASAPNIPKPYTVGTWGGMPNYECNVREVDGGLCPHATLSEEGAWLHYVGKHIREQRPSEDELLDEEDEFDEEE